MFFVLFGPEAKILSLRLALFSAVSLSSRPPPLVSLAPPHHWASALNFNALQGPRKARDEEIYEKKYLEAERDADFMHFLDARAAIAVKFN
jgi:hypothetical protein